MPAIVQSDHPASLASAHAAPQNLCLLRTSALGDVTHVVPLVRSLQEALPRTRLTWIIGALERKLVGDIDGVEFATFDKSRGFAGWRALRQALAGRRFDALLHMQVALRANLASVAVRADRRIGYDHARSRDLHGAFINERIAARTGQHVLDAIGSFAEPLGVVRRAVRWDIPIPDEAQAWAREQWPDDAPTLLVSPCSSHALRNWNVAGYAAVADHAVQALKLRVVLAGGPGPAERAMGDAIRAAMRTAPVDLIGKDTLKRALALYRRAHLVLTPDSGPMHMANAVGTRVLGLHAASNPARSGPYSDRRWCVDRYDDAARRFRRKPAAELPWGSKIEVPGVMDLIGVDDVIERLEAFAAAGGFAGTLSGDSPGRTSPPPGASRVSG
jgi:heptosyltransferase I